MPVLEDRQALWVQSDSAAERQRVQAQADDLCPIRVAACVHHTDTVQIISLITSTMLCSLD